MVLSKWGEVNGKWADGDLDGDLNFTSSSVLRSGPLSPGNLNKPLLCRIVKVCFLAALVQLVQDTAPFVDGQDYEARSRLMQCAAKYLQTSVWCLRS